MALRRPVGCSVGWGWGGVCSSATGSCGAVGRCAPPPANPAGARYLTVSVGADPSDPPMCVRLVAATLERPRERSGRTAARARLPVPAGEAGPTGRRLACLALTAVGVPRGSAGHGPVRLRRRQREGGPGTAARVRRGAPLVRGCQRPPRPPSVLLDLSGPAPGHARRIDGPCPGGQRRSARTLAVRVPRTRAGTGGQRHLPAVGTDLPSARSAMRPRLIDRYAAGRHLPEPRGSRGTGLAGRHHGALGRARPSAPAARTVPAARRGGSDGPGGRHRPGGLGRRVRRLLIGPPAAPPSGGRPGGTVGAALRAVVAEVGLTRGTHGTEALQERVRRAPPGAPPATGPLTVRTGPVGAVRTARVPALAVRIPAPAVGIGVLVTRVGVLVIPVRVLVARVRVGTVRVRVLAVGIGRPVRTGPRAGHRTGPAADRHLKDVRAAAHPGDLVRLEHPAMGTDDAAHDRLVDGVTTRVGSAHLDADALPRCAAATTIVESM